LALALGMHIKQIDTPGRIDPDKAAHFSTLKDKDGAGFKTPPPSRKIRRLRRPG